MASRSSEQEGDGTHVSLPDRADLPSGPPAHGQRLQTPLVSAPAIGKLQNVMGSVTITRANVIAQPAVGDLVYEGDLIETGIDGFAEIVFVDGTTFRLYDSAHMVLDEFVFARERPAKAKPKPRPVVRERKCRRQASTDGLSLTVAGETDLSHHTNDQRLLGGGHL